MRHQASIAAAILVLGAGLGACSIVHRMSSLVSHHHPAPMRIQPVETALASTNVRPDDGLYADAVHAIDTRNYGAALDLLQAARDRSSDDVRVVNAFAVVYDKLGRFDLSRGYYLEAEKLDPGSAIVKQNLAYSAMLQDHATGRKETPTLALATPELSPATGDGVIRIAPGVVEIRGAPENTAMVRTLPLITGHPLVLVDASGSPGAIGPIRLELARAGWSLPKSVDTFPKAETQTQIVYPQGQLPAAQALARTLDHPVRLAACDDKCEAVRLIFGTDVLSWRSTQKHMLRHRTA